MSKAVEKILNKNDIDMKEYHQGTCLSTPRTEVCGEAWTTKQLGRAQDDDDVECV